MAAREKTIDIKIIIALLSAGFLLLAAGLSFSEAAEDEAGAQEKKSYVTYTDQTSPPTLFRTSELADQLTLSLRGAKGLVGKRIVVLPFVDLNDLQISSDFGRVAGEELASALHFRNFHLADIRSDETILMARQVGELYLSRTGPDRWAGAESRAVGALAKRYNLGGVVVGTYTVMVNDISGKFYRWLTGITGRVALNARLIDLNSGAVLSVGSVKVDLNPAAQALLKRRTSPRTIPLAEMKVRK